MITGETVADYGNWGVIADDDYRAQVGQCLTTIELNLV